jgi:hypothetical protein
MEIQEHVAARQIAVSKFTAGVMCQWGIMGHHLER